MTEKRAWGPKAADGKWDVIVIGAGIGGLTTANVLAQLGRRVLVLEQHTIPGGFTQSFRRGKWAWDVGLHVVGEMGPAGMLGRVLAALSGDRLRWTTIEGAYDEVELPTGQRVPIPGRLSQLRDSYNAAFPRERAGIDKYFQKLREGAAGMRDFFVARSLTPWTHRAAVGPNRALALSRTAEVLDSVTEDPMLRAVMGVHWGFYGTPPSRSAFGVHALLARHYRHGAYYPVGGAMSIPRALSSSLADHAGWVQTSTDVAQITVKHGHATGVRLKSGDELRANAIVSGAGILNTLRMLPVEEQREEWVEPVAALPSSCSNVCLHVGFDGDIRSAGASQTNAWLMSGTPEEVWSTEGTPLACYVSFPSLKDGEAHGGAHTAEVVVLTGWEPFERFNGLRWRQRGEEYEALKQRITATLRGLMLKRFPGLAAMIVYEELSTPVSAAHFVRADRGAAYGLEASRGRFENRWLRPRTPVKGLHLAGCDVSMVGIGGALVGGLAAAVSLEPEPSARWLRRAVRR